MKSTSLTYSKLVITTLLVSAPIFADDDPTKPPPVPSELTDGYFGRPAKAADRLVRMNFGVCGGIYDQRWADAGLPIECGCPKPDQLPLPKIHRQMISIDLDCGRVNSGDPEKDAEFDRENPSQFHEQICRNWRSQLFSSVISGLKDSQQNSLIAKWEDDPIDEVSNTAPTDKEVEALGEEDVDINNLSQEQEDLIEKRRRDGRVSELKRRMGLYIGSYKPFGGGTSFFQCVGAVDFLNVKICPNRIPQRLRGSGEKSEEKLNSCMKDAIKLIRDKTRGIKYVDLWDLSSDWGSFETAHFLAITVGDSAVNDGDVNGLVMPGRDFTYLSFDQVINNLESIAECDPLNTSDPDKPGNVELEKKRKEFNDKVHERAEKLREAFQKQIAQAAAEYNEKNKPPEDEEGSGSGSGSAPAPTPTPPVLDEDPEGVDVQVRVPCDLKCDLEQNK